MLKAQYKRADSDVFWRFLLEPKAARNDKGWRRLSFADRFQKMEMKVVEGKPGISHVMTKLLRIIPGQCIEVFVRNGRKPYLSPARIKAIYFTGEDIVAEISWLYKVKRNGLVERGHTDYVSGETVNRTL